MAGQERFIPIFEKPIGNIDEEVRTAFREHMRRGITVASSRGELKRKIRAARLEARRVVFGTAGHNTFKRPLLDGAISNVIHRDIP